MSGMITIYFLSTISLKFTTSKFVTLQYVHGCHKPQKSWTRYGRSRVHLISNLSCFFQGKAVHSVHSENWTINNIITRILSHGYHIFLSFCILYKNDQTFLISRLLSQKGPQYRAHPPSGFLLDWAPAPATVGQDVSLWEWHPSKPPQES